MLWLLKPPPPEPAARLRLPLQPPDVPPLKDPGNVQGGISERVSGRRSRMPAAAWLREAGGGGGVVEGSALHFGGRSAAAGSRSPSTSRLRRRPARCRTVRRRNAAASRRIRPGYGAPRRPAGRFAHQPSPALAPAGAATGSLGVNAPDIGEDDPAPRIDLSGVHAVRPGAAAGLEYGLTESQGAVDGRDAEAGRRHRREATVAAMDAASANRQVTMSRSISASSTAPPIRCSRKAKPARAISNHVNLGEVLCGYPNLADKTAPYADAPEFIRSLLQDGSFLARTQAASGRRGARASLERAQTGRRGRGACADARRLHGQDDGTLARRPPAKAGHPLAVVPNPDPLSNDFHFDTDKDGSAVPVPCAHTARQSAGPESGSRQPAAPLCTPRHVLRPAASGRDSNGAYASESPAAGARPYLHGLQRQSRRTVRSGAELAERRQQFGLIFGPERSLPRPRRTGPAPLFPLRAQRTNGPHGARRFGSPARRAASLRAPGMGSLSVRAFQEGARDLAGSEPRRKATKRRGDMERGRRARRRSHDCAKSKRALAKRRPVTAWKIGARRSRCGRRFHHAHRSGRPFASVTAACCDTPFGVLVAERSMVEQVLQDPDRNLSITGYLPRMRRSFGVLYLGLDAGPGRRRV